MSSLNELLEADEAIAVPANVPGVADDLKGKDLLTLDKMRSELMNGRGDFNELSEAELERWLQINAAIRLTGRVAAKPAAAPRKKKNADQRPLSALLAEDDV